MNRGEYRTNDESAPSLSKKVLPIVAAGMTASGCALLPFEIAKPVERPVVECGPSCRYELAVEQDFPQMQESKSFKLITNTNDQLHFRLEGKDFVPCYVRVDGSPYLFYNKEGFHTGVLTLGISPAPKSFISEYEFRQALDRAQADLFLRTGISITFSDDVSKKKPPTKSQELLANDSILGRIFDAGSLSSVVSLDSVWQGMPDAFSELSMSKRLSLVIPMLERETLRTILFPGTVAKGKSLMGSAPETALRKFKSDLAGVESKKAESISDFTTYLTLDSIENDTSTLIARSVSGSYIYSSKK